MKKIKVTSSQNVSYNFSAPAGKIFLGTFMLFRCLKATVRLT